MDWRQLARKTPWGGKAAPDRRAPRSRTGCGYLLVTCLVSLVFLTLNIGIVLTLVPLVTADGEGAVGDGRLPQAILYFAPALLLLMEWVLFDLVVDRVGSANRDRS